MTKYNEIQYRRLDMQSCLEYFKNKKDDTWDGICNNLYWQTKDFFTEKYIEPLDKQLIGKVPYLAVHLFDDKIGTFGKKYGKWLITLEDYLMYVCNVPMKELTHARMKQYRIDFIKWILKNDPDYGGKPKKEQERTNTKCHHNKN